MKDFLADVTLRVQPNPSRRARQNLPAHKVILASGSGYFRALFSTELPAPAPSSSSSSGESSRMVLNLTDISLGTVHSLLEFIYTNRLLKYPAQDLDARLELIRAAEYYQMEDLHIHVAEDIIKQDLSTSTVLKVLGEAIKYKGICSALLKDVKEYVKREWEVFMECEDFRQTLRGLGTDLIVDLYE
ncbi:hypothetical protein HDV00_012218 [Rhizophlyctis rosea]|nr:hypothetical protein HDV00_012218 [Rhizophlyctis rosea]